MGVLYSYTYIWAKAGHISPLLVLGHAVRGCAWLLALSKRKNRHIFAWSGMLIEACMAICMCTSYSQLSKFGHGQQV